MSLQRTWTMTGKSMRKTIGTTRRSFLGQAGAGGFALVSGSAWIDSARAETSVDLPLPQGPKARVITTSFPQKAAMILQRTRPPLLETPVEVFDRGVFTPNDSFFVRWHWAVIPTEVDVNTFRLSVRGHVERELSMTLKEIVDGLPRVELAAVNQCSGNSRGYTEPAVAGAPKLMKSLEVDHARDGEVMIAYAMNGEQLPLLNGFPLRLIVPGWYSTYWVKMLNSIEVLDGPDDNYWMKTAYLIPDTPGATMKPGQTDVKMVPINKMVPRSFVTNLKAGVALKAGARTAVRGIAFGGSTAVKSVEYSIDRGQSWHQAQLGKDEGKYGFRQWQTQLALPTPGEHALLIRCTNSNGVAQPETPNWNPAGFMRNVVESIDIIAV